MRSLRRVGFLTTPPQFPPNQQPGQYGAPAGGPYQPPGNQHPGQPYGAPGPHPGQHFGGNPQPPKKGGSSTTVILFVLLGVFVLLFGGCIAVITVSNRAIDDKFDEFTEEASENRRLIVANSVVTECGVNGSGNPQATVAFTSPFPDMRNSATVTLKFLVDSTEVAIGQVSFSDIEPNQVVTGEFTNTGVEGLNRVECEISGGTVTGS